MIADKHTIQVKGIGRVSRTPDTIIIWMHVESCDTDYKRAVDSAAQQLNLIRANLGTIGFTKEDLKTTGFDIHARYDNIRQGDNTYKEVFIGYEVRHDLSLSFPKDMTKLDEVISVLSMCLADPDVRIGFALSDIDGAKKEILEKATKDALEKANILCNAANVKLGQLLSIDYSWDEISFEAYDKFRMSDLSIGCEKASFDFEPDDIKASDTVEFTWEIK